MSVSSLTKIINEKVADELGLSNTRDKIKNNIQYIKKHPIFNTSIFLHEDQELVKSYLEKVTILISDNNSDQNIEKFMNLFSTQVDFLKADVDHLFHLINSDPPNERKTLVNTSNFLKDPFDGSDKVNFLIDQEKIKLVNRIKHGVVSLVDVANQFNNLYEAVNKTIPPFLDDVMKHVNEELISFRRVRNIADNAKTEDIYDKAVNRYRNLEVDYRFLFYLSIGITLIFSILVFSLKGQLVPNFFSNVEFWAIKLSLLAVGITLITYFLKQSTHYQRLADQNYQTQIELQAYPSFMESIPTEEAASVRKELALKYFGREIDGAAHKDMSNLISDQMKNTTELVKAATDVLKAKV